MKQAVFESAVTKLLSGGLPCFCSKCIMSKCHLFTSLVFTAVSFSLKDQKYVISMDYCATSSKSQLNSSDYTDTNYFACMQFGETALVKATWRGWIDICQMLIDAGIDVNAQDIVSCCYNYMHACATIRTAWADILQSV